MSWPLFDGISKLGLKVTARASQPLAAFRDELEKSSNSSLSSEQAETMRKLMLTIRPTFIAEATGVIAYIVSERRIPIERLLQDIGTLFGAGVFERLPAFAQADFSEAGKCLAFERATSAAFHALRATESTLKKYYSNKIKGSDPALMWAGMVSALRSVPGAAPKVLLNQLDHGRDGFRNPTAHPEKMYDMDEAQDLLSICIDVSNRIVADLNLEAR